MAYKFSLRSRIHEAELRDGIVRIETIPIELDIGANYDVISSTYAPIVPHFDLIGIITGDKFEFLHYVNGIWNIREIETNILLDYGLCEIPKDLRHNDVVQFGYYASGALARALCIDKRFPDELYFMLGEDEIESTRIIKLEEPINLKNIDRYSQERTRSYVATNTVDGVSILDGHGNQLVVNHKVIDLIKEV